MSASPAGLTPSRTPNDGQGPKLRRAKNADPLVRPKKRTQRPPTVNGAPSQLPNGARPTSHGHPQPMLQDSARPSMPFAPPSVPLSNSGNGTSGFSSPLISQTYQDFPLVLSKRSLAEGFRHHVARFASKKNIDPRNSEEFVRPVRLHRRDPRAPPGGAGGMKMDEDMQDGMDGMDDKEREKQEILKAEKEAKREAELAQVAPAASTGAPRTHGKNKKKTEQIYRNDQTDEQKKQSQLRYEEAMPWHLEDFENKNTWVGSYEAALSDNYVMMIFGQDGALRLVPLEKWYKFTQKNVFKTLTADEAELRFNKKIKEPRWFMDSEESRQRRRMEQENKKLASGLFIGKWERGAGGSGQAAPVTKHENADADDLDFQEDRFADDEDNMNLFEEDQETKETEERIKKDQLQANVFDTKEEKEYEKQEHLEKREKELAKKHGKRTKKALMKREKNYIYDSESSSNPYTEESESDDTEAELLKEEERKKAEERKVSPEKDKPSKSKSASASSSKGNSTPSNRSSKHSDPLKSSSSSNLKRPGSPLNSEASGNESNRKKIKKKHPLSSSSQPPSQMNNHRLDPPSRPTSPPLPPSTSAPQPTLSRKSSNLPAKRSRGQTSGNDTDGDAGSGGDMSDGTRKRQKIRLNAPSKTGTPQASRGGSPEATGTNTTKAGAVPAGGRRAESPTTAPAPAPSPTTTSGELSLPTPAELVAQLPPPGVGIKTNALLKRFPGRLATDERRKKFFTMVKKHTIFQQGTLLLFRKEEREEEKGGGKDGAKGDGKVEAKTEPKAASSAEGNGK